MYSPKAMTVPGLVKAKAESLNAKKVVAVSNRIYLSPQGRFYYAEAVFLRRSKTNYFLVCLLALVFIVVSIAL